MPELPEVETIVRDLAPRLTGRRIAGFEVIAPLVVKTALEGLAGETIRAVRRHGKTVVLECGRGVLTIHLGMTGKLLSGGLMTAYTRVVFTLDQGELLYEDVRQFGRIHWGERMPERLDRLGPDALAISEPDFASRLRSRQSCIKAMLLNQQFLRGLGNIYADEALFRARMHPRAIASSISRPRAKALYRAMREVLAEAIEHRGSSVSDYVDASGARGGFQQLHRVYGRQNQPCTACGAPIRRIVVAQRGTHFCPRCQRR